ncbi:MAG: DUF3499 family protein [Nitriliruptorales bacterium]
MTERQVAGDRVPAGASMLSRTCARPGCSAPAAATLAFFYGDREVCLERLGLDELPSTYDLCATHADRMRPPYGWVLNDRRAVPQRTEAGPGIAEPRNEATVVAAESQSPHDPSPPLGWLGMAVEATVAFYGPGWEGMANSFATADPGREETRATERATGEVVPDDSEPAPEGPDLDEVGPTYSGFDAGRFEDPDPDEVRLEDPVPDDDAFQEDFVPVRARSW